MQLKRSKILCLALALCSNTAFALLQPSDEWEKHLFKNLDDSHDEMAREHELLENDQLNQVLLQISQDLKISSTDYRISVLKTDDVNAGALPNGQIYIDEGLFFLMDNTAEIAAVLAHEVLHVEKKHGAIERKNRNKNAARSSWTGTLTLGLGSIATGIYAAVNESSFSIEQENEADQLGLQRLKDAGYDISASASSFRKMYDVLKDYGVKEKKYLSTHPKMLERIETAEKQLVGYDASIAKGNDKESFFKLQTVLLPSYLELYDGNPSALIFEFSLPRMQKFAQNEQVMYALAKAHMTRNADIKTQVKIWKAMKKGDMAVGEEPNITDLDKAITLYRDVIAKNPNAIDALYDLGSCLAKTGDKAAVDYFTRFNTLAVADDSRKKFAQYYMTKLGVTNP